MKETRQVILNSLEVLIREFPEQRVGQIIYNYICRYCPNADCFFITDEKLLEILEKTLEKISH